MGAPLVGEVEVLSGDLSGRHYAVHEDGFMIGRSSGCDLVLPKRYISRQHARIERQGDDWVLGSLSETNPVLVKDRPSGESHRLCDGDELDLGGIKIRWRASGSGSGSGSRPGSRDRVVFDVEDAPAKPGAADETGDVPAPARARRSTKSSGAGSKKGSTKSLRGASRSARLKVQADPAPTPAARASAASKDTSDETGELVHLGSTPESPADRTAELGKVVDPNDPNYDPFAAIEAKKKKERTVDPIRQRLLRTFMVIGAVGIVGAVALVKVLSTPPVETTVVASRAITLAPGQALRFDEPFASIDRPQGPTTTRLDGEAQVVLSNNICDVEWVTPHVRTRGTFLVRAKELGETELTLTFPSTNRKKIFRIVVDGDDPAEAAREARRAALRKKSLAELRQLADDHLASGAAYEREREVVHKECNFRLALRQYIFAVDAANVLRATLAKQGVVPPVDQKRVMACEEAEGRARADYEEFVTRELASYRANLQRGSDKADLVAQLKRVLRAICNDGDARFQRLRLLLEESYNVRYDSDGSELDDTADPK